MPDHNDDDDNNNDKDNDDDDDNNLIPITPSTISSIPYATLLSHQTRITTRLTQILPPNQSLSSSSPSTTTLTTTTRKRPPRTLTPTITPTTPPLIPKIDTHWDYLLKEMMWLAADFRTERKRQTSSAKRFAQSASSYLASRETRRLRELAERNAKMRRLAGRTGRDVKRWWGKIEKIIGYKQKLEGEEVKRKEMDRHLVALVKRTERYGRELCSGEEGLLEEGVRGSIEQVLRGEMMERRTREGRRGDDDATLDDESVTTATTNNTNKRVTFADNFQTPSPMRSIDDDSLDNDNGDDGSEEFSMDETDAVDDETTMEAEEKLGRDMTYLEEISMLEKENEMSVEELRAKYGGLVQPLAANNPSSSSEGEMIDEIETIDNMSQMEDENDLSGHNHIANILTEDDNTDEEEFSPTDINEVDDETTMEAEEKLGRDMTYQEEIDLLQKENEMSVDELRALYGGVVQSLAIPPSSPTENTKDEMIDSDNSSTEEMKDDIKMADNLSNEEMKNEVIETATNPSTEDIDNNLSRKKSPVTTKLEEKAEEMKDDINTADNSSAEGIKNEEMETANNYPSSEVTTNDNTPSRKDAKEDDKAEENSTVRIQIAAETINPSAKVTKDDGIVETCNDNINNDKNMSTTSDGLTDDNTIVSPPNQQQESNEKTTIKTKEKDDMTIQKEEITTLSKMSSRTSVVPSLFTPSSMKETVPEDTVSIPTVENSVVHTATEANNETSTKAHEEQPKTTQEDSTTTTASNDHTANVLDILADNDGDDNTEDNEYSPIEQIDDETTMEAEEKLGRDMTYQEEIDLLQKENEMSIEDLRAMYANMTQSPDNDNDDSDDGSNDDASNDNDTQDSPDVTSSPSYLSNLNTPITDQEDANDDEFSPSNVNEVDDETTMDVEERLGRDMTYEEELDLLKRENEMSVEELRAKYLANYNEMDDDSDHSNSDDDDDNYDAQKETADTTEPKTINNTPENNKRQKQQHHSPPSVVTRPFLLSPWVALRHYQQIGLTWLVSLQTRRLNGILADEMGLGKTLQTISLLAYLAAYKGIWGPHLIVVPTSCIVNWETELKRFCPAFKVLTYYGTAKKRKELRVGWTKTNWHHVIITSYQLVVQDAFAFKRKKWYYLVLDEAHNIKNFQSQRWQTLVNFNTRRRLLLTGTPLQNNLMELWSLLHFLMPHIFSSRKEFSYWFSNPLSNVIEGTTSLNTDLISRLHNIIRPFILRRLKKDVETQMPGKFEHVVKCRLSRRQMFLYEEFMARSSTRMALGGNFMGMMNVLMQLRKVCNHPDLFEPRGVVTPLALDRIEMTVARCVVGIKIEGVSEGLLKPLWCLGGSVDVEEMLSHDSIMANQLRLYETPSMEIRGRIDHVLIREAKPEDSGGPKKLKALLRKKYDMAKLEALGRLQLQARINECRCRYPASSITHRLLKSCNANITNLRPLPDNDEIPTNEDDRRSLLGSFMNSPLALLDMIKSTRRRVADIDPLIRKFIFCVPKSSLPPISLHPSPPTSETLLTPLLTTHLHPTRKIQSNLSSFFPCKSLLQFDCGKLTRLASLLRDLKKDHHKCLIFTQMSKMLDILESFLNYNGHTYLRLDGSTSVEKRQHLMDRFNNDPKIFCFILSTRSGGLGINLTGADTVIFYDSDWNPAMDAQAQDRAHRIGQTREVHIYRLVTESTVEENILVKARQKRQLDFLVMEEGKVRRIH